MSGGPHVLEPRPLDHVVAFYDDDADLTAEVTQFLTEGFEADEAAVVIATPSHRRSFEAALREAGVSVDRLVREGHLVWLDAEATLTALSVGGTPNRNAFLRVIDPVVAGAGDGGRRIRAFGEMVGLLWEQGDVDGAIALESFWNELCAQTRLSLYCAYPAASLAGADLSSVTDVCAQHSALLPPASYADEPVREDGIDEATEVAHLFLPTPRAAGAVRRFTGDTLEAWGVSDFIWDVAIVASELTTNAIRHASSPFRVILRRSKTSITISVHDVSPSKPMPRNPEPDALNGRGLAIVDQLSTQWGTDFTPDGKVVWATLPKPA